MHTLTCQHCQNKFEATRPHARTCSPACRMALHRQPNGYPSSRQAHLARRGHRHGWTVKKPRAIMDDVFVGEQVFLVDATAQELFRGRIRLSNCYREAGRRWWPLGDVTISIRPDGPMEEHWPYDGAEEATQVDLRCTFRFADWLVGLDDAKLEAETQRLEKRFGSAQCGI